MMSLLSWARTPKAFPQFEGCLSTSSCSKQDQIESHKHRKPSKRSSSFIQSSDQSHITSEAQCYGNNITGHSKVKSSSGSSFVDFHQQYIVIRHLGEGSYSTVKQVTHRRHGGMYACKIVDKAALTPVDRVALGQEVQVLSIVKHENVMALHDVIEDDKKCYLIMELAENGDLFDRIVKRGKFSESEAQKVAAALVEGVHYCHENAIIHRDIKPENVLLSGENVKLCDFGFAKHLKNENEQSTDSCGTPGYAAPEILDGKPYGIEVDIFSLGVVIYIMLCGYPPFPMKLAQLRTHRFNVRFPKKDWSGISKEAINLITQMLDIHPTCRPKSEALRCHPWIVEGRKELNRLVYEEKMRKEEEHIKQLESTASFLREKMLGDGFEVVKFSRNGQSHRTKLKLSRNGMILSWQPKLLKRGLLRYQNAPSIMNLLGITSKGKEKTTNRSRSKAKLKDVECRTPVLPTTSDQDLTLITIMPTHQGRYSERSSSEDHESLEEVAVGGKTSHSNNGKASETKKSWWKSLSRSRERRDRCESDIVFSSDIDGLKSISLQTGNRVRHGSDGSVTMSTQTTEMSYTHSSSFSASPYTDSHQHKKLDSSINFQEVLSIHVGNHSEFFSRLYKIQCQTPPQSTSSSTQDPKLDLASVLSLSTASRGLHLEFPSEHIRDACAVLLQQLVQPHALCETNSMATNEKEIDSCPEKQIPEYQTDQIAVPLAE